MKVMHTVGPLVVTKPTAVASTATMVAISCSRVFVSLELVLLDLSCESLACTHGCRDTWTFVGREVVAIMAAGS
jgi:hypothetical protein